MTIEHIAIYVGNLEKMKNFYETYFGGVSNKMYHNPISGLKSYFLSFGSGARLELMSSPKVENDVRSLYGSGLIHMAFKVGSAKEVNNLTARLHADGYNVLSGPRTTGDGYYESCIQDPEGNQVEITC